MKQTINSVKRYVCAKEVTREELMMHKIKSPVLESLYETALQRMDSQKKTVAEKKIS